MPRDHEHEPGEIWGHFAIINQKLDLIIALLNKEEIQMSAVDDAITKLQGDVTNLTSVDASAVTLINGIAAQISAAVAAAQAAGATPAQLAALSALSTAIEAQDTALAAAVTANTPAAPATGATGTTGATGP